MTSTCSSTPRWKCSTGRSATPHSHLLLLDEEGRRLYTIASRGFGADSIGAEVVVGDGLIGMAAQRCEPIAVGNLLQMAKYSRSMRAQFEDSGGVRPGREVPMPGLDGRRQPAGRPRQGARRARRRARRRQHASRRLRRGRRADARRRGDDARQRDRARPLARARPARPGRRPSTRRRPHRAAATERAARRPCASSRSTAARSSTVTT